MSSEGFEAGGPDQVRLGVLCTGLHLVGIHHEYVFRLSHPCGCSWIVQKRYRELLELHEDLSHNFSGLPAFPPKRSFGERLIISEQDAATRRVVQLQRYLQLLCLREDVLEAPSLFRELGAMMPNAVSAVRVTSWHFQEASPRETAEAELEVRPDISPEGCCRPVEGFEVEVFSVRGGSNTGSRPCTILLGAAVRVPGLPCGTLAELRVRAWNAVGRSEPVSLRIAVPDAPINAAPSTDESAASLPEGCIAARPYPSKLPHASRVATQASDHHGTTFSLSACAPLFSARDLNAGSRVQAIWAGDGEWYDAVIRRLDGDGCATVDWLRPAPLGVEILHCVCESGGDDTMHRRVRCAHLRSPRRHAPASSNGVSSEGIAAVR